MAARAQPQTVTLVGSSCGGEGEGERTLQLALVQPGDLLRVLPGARVPADGVVVSGRSSVDESMITGEPMPVDVEAGAAVVGGTLNGQGTLIVRVERVGADATLAQIVQLVQDAQVPPGPRCSSACLCRTTAVVLNASFSRRHPRPTSSAWQTGSPGASCQSS